MAEVDKQPWLRSWMIWTGGGLAALVLLLLIAAGGGDRGDPEGVVNPIDDGSAVNRERCRRQLSGILEALQPTRLGVSSSADDLADDLNLWWADCGASAGPVMVETDSLQPLLKPEVLQRVASDRFDVRDATHIRNCRLYRTVAEGIAASFDREQDRVVAAFDYAVRQVADLPKSSSQPALPCVEAALFGQAESPYRAWLFAEVLRQLGIDCLIIEPAVEESVSRPTDVRLVGAIVPGEGVYLFDPGAGMAIPGPSVDGRPSELPATLEDVRSDDDLLRQLDIPDGPTYPWDAELFRQITVKVIGDCAWWSPRMARLQSELPGDFSMTIFDGLVDSPYQSAGLLDRVHQAGAGGLWDEDDVSIWDYPETQIAEFYAAGGEAGEVISQRMRVLKAPKLLVPQGGGVVVEMDSPRPLRLVRMQHLSGNLAAALKGLGAVRSAASANPETVNELAKEDSVYWIALCQYEMNRSETALSNLDIYIRTYPTGIWLGAVRTLRAHCLSRLGRYEEAAASLLEKTAGGRPLSFGESYLVRQWQEMASSAGTVD